MARILVTDGDQRSALAAVRSLGTAGHQVFVCSASGRSLAGRSRYTRCDRAVPDAISRPVEFGKRVRALIRSQRIELLFPMTDASIGALLQADITRDDVVLPLPRPEVYNTVSNKIDLLQTAERIGIQTPHGVRVESPQHARSLRLSEVEPPLVIKPSRSVVGTGDSQVETTVRYAFHRQEMRSLLDELPASVFPVLIQEYIEGVGEGVFLLTWDGRTLASFAHRRIREKPPSGGVSVYREAVEPDPSLVRASEELLESFGWRGVAMIEYKRSSSDGKAYLMEVNGRFWGSLQLAVDAGVDFPSLLADAALGNNPEPVTTYRTGIRCRWWWGDVDHLVARLRGSSPVHESDGAGGRLSAILSFLAFRPEDRWEVFRWRDPMPFLQETRQWFTASLDLKV